MPRRSIASTLPPSEQTNVCKPQRTRASAFVEAGLALDEAGQVDEAFSKFRDAVQLDPAHGLAWRHLGNLLRRARRLGAASECFERAIASGDDRRLNEFFLSATGIGDVVPSAPAEFVAALFDQYASRFDDHLVTALDYRAPALLAALISDRHGASFQSILELGCGTGLVGKVFKPISESITGLDLSREMLARAALTGAYQRLVRTEFLEFMRSTGDRYSLVLGCDVFIYVGDLSEVFAAAARVLRPGGDFLFTTERCEAALGYDLLPTLRFAHSAGYIHRLATEHGFRVRADRTDVLREENGEPVDGQLFRLSLR